IPQLEAAGNLVKVETYVNQVGFSERTDAMVEPRLSMQWWVSMKQIAEPALEAVMQDDIHFHPAKFKNLYRHWMENIKDWCISRQLWWGHRIPAYYAPDGSFVVAKSAEEALELLQKEQPRLTKDDIRQDEGCLDTWFSSWLWPFEVFHGLSQPGNKEVNYYYPTSTLVTAPEIIFFWVARMIMAGYEYMGKLPFKDVYFTGIVRDKQGRKMSKSLGNSPDLLGLIDQYGADAVRFGIMIASPAGNDILFDEAGLEQGRHFNNKLWNAMRLVHGWKERISQDADGGAETAFARNWFQQRLLSTKAEVAEMMQQFRLSEALKTIYSLIWDDYCSWYLEWVKPGMEQPVSQEVYEQTVGFFEELLHLLHPFMPFITEEIYHLLRTQSTDLCVRPYAEITNVNEDVLAAGSLLQQLISALRDARNKQQIKPKTSIELAIQTEHPEKYREITHLLSRQVNASSIQFTSDAIARSIVVAVEQDRFYISAGEIGNTVVQKEGLLKDLQHQQQFLEQVRKKLQNEKFVNNAKSEVIAMERKKEADAMARIATIESALKELSND
ncbi:MAG: class I tRNA ligase family protein, partial [Chitinophagaceae bacterium]|nr:class I tRNA ligase family protein [Chitinophagaceae bacterium]